MLLQPISSNLPPNCGHHNHGDLHLSNSVSFLSPRLPRTIRIQPLRSTGNEYHLNHPACSSLYNSHRYRSIDYENRHTLSWKAVCTKISILDSADQGSASVLNQVEREGQRLPKWDLCRIVKELRNFRRYRSALEVYEWMNSKGERYIITSSDAAIQLDLIAKVKGVPQAEKYFLKLPAGLKDRRIYGSLLNVYARSGMKDKAESLMQRMRNRYATHTLAYNVMMTLYTKHNEHDKIEPLVSEMKEKNIPLDACTYNIWLSSCGYQGSIEKMERVFNQMQLDTAVNPIWTTFSTVATMYIRLGNLEKAQDCLKKVESRMSGQGRDPYHHLIRLYGNAGQKTEVYRIWNAYKASFAKIPNVGFHTVISALIKLDDIDGAERIYNEWLSVKSKYDPRIGNLVLGKYVKEGQSEKAEAFFQQMVDAGGKVNSTTWEIRSEDCIRNMTIPEAVSCLQNAASVDGLMRWKPKPAIVSSILDICKREDDVASKDALMEVLRQVGCLDDLSYMSCVRKPGSGKIVQAVGDHDDDGKDAIVDELVESL